ncbi:MAG: hypothetical protein AAF745_12835, partial [Planctomycetota bacterium]
LIAEHCDIEMQIGITARYSQALMFSEQRRHQEAVDSLAPIIDRLGKDSTYKNRLNRQMLSYISPLQSLYQFEKALALLQLANQPDNSSTSLDEVKKALQRAYRQDGNHNPDILIAMYRLQDPADPEWRESVLKQVRSTSDQLLREILQTESERRPMNPVNYRQRLGGALNQYAWLVCNTEGDYGRALKFSKKSIELCTKNEVDSRAARLDTCARCYFAVGKFAEAVETQKMAMRSDPYSPQMKRQLKEFEAALAIQQQKSPQSNTQ